MPSVRVFVYTNDRLNDIGIETKEKMVIDESTKKSFLLLFYSTSRVKNWLKLDITSPSSMTAFARPSLLDNRYAVIAETSAYTYDDDLVDYAEFLR